MEAAKTQQGLFTVYSRHYSDWMEFVSRAERVRREGRNQRFGGMKCASLEPGRSDWYGTDSLAEAIDLAHRGWPEGRRRFSEMWERLELRHLLPTSRRTTTRFDVSGDEPDIDRFLSCEPENMVTIDDPISSKRGKVVRFVLNQAMSAYVSADTIIRRGTAVLAAMESLMVLGFSPEVRLAFSVHSGTDVHEEYIPILHAGDPINLDTFTFMFSHPSVLRRLDFAANECEPKGIRKMFGFYDEGGYGRPSKPILLDPEHDLLIDANEGQVSSERDIVPYAISLLKRVGVDTGVETVS